MAQHPELIWIKTVHVLACVWKSKFYGAFCWMA